MTKKFLIALLTVGAFFNVGEAFAAGPQASNADPIELPAYNFSTQIVNSFGIGIDFKGDPKTRKISHAYINAVADGSDADREGLTVGDEILTVNGRAINEFSMNIGKGGELFPIFINQTPGTKVKLTVAVKKVKTVVLSATRVNPFDTGF